MMLCDLSPGDEVILPSFTFVSAANAIVLRGATPVFIDCRMDNFNIDESLIAQAITSKTKAILIMHYGGVSCDMDAIMEIAEHHQLLVIEDAAHCIEAYDKNGIHLGTRGHMAALSFHHTKNIHCGEGGALLINDSQHIDRAIILRDKGTNRQSFLEGHDQFYSWVDVGSSYSMSEMSARFLLEQLYALPQVIEKRLSLWNQYDVALRDLSYYNSSALEGCHHNGHIFYLIFGSLDQRDFVMRELIEAGIDSRFHYVPLHSSPYGSQFRFVQEEDRTTKMAECMLRLPLYHTMTSEQVAYVIHTLRKILI